VERHAAEAASLSVLDAHIADCFACPRLVAWREDVARTRRAAFREQEYWGRPVPGFGVADPEIAILGLAPAAHGGNRTGRIFTGDRSGDVLFAAVRCVPPDNKPTPDERDTCAPWLHHELSLIRPTLRVVVALGAFAWAAWWPAMASAYGVRPPVPRPRFGHGAQVSVPGAPDLLGSFHVSQQNTFTGRLTPAMLDEVFARAKSQAGLA
jgi:uracil-DNA glycosylase